MIVVAYAVRWALLAVAVVLAAWATPDADLRGGPVSALVVAVLVAAANLVAQVALKWIPMPDNILALAALTLVVNGCVVWVASAFTTRLRIDGIVAAVTFAMLVTVFAVALGAVAEKLLDRADGSAAGDTT